MLYLEISRAQNILEMDSLVLLHELSADKRNRKSVQTQLVFTLLKNLESMCLK